MTTTALASTRYQGLELYASIWRSAKDHFWDTTRASALNEFEHRFDDAIIDVDSAQGYARQMLASLNDKYTKLIDTVQRQSKAAAASLGSGSAASGILTDNIGYLRIESFTAENIAEQVRLALADIQHCDGFIIDLRGNPGGLVNATVNCVELFVEEGMITTLESQGSKGVTKTGIYFKPDLFVKLVERADGEEEIDRHIRMASVTKGRPTVLLIDNSTCSSAELFAAALLEAGKENDTCIAIGARTSGKGIVQDTFEFDQCSLVITSGRYLSPTEQWFGDHGQTVANGIEPNIRVRKPDAKATLRTAHEVLCAKLGKEIRSTQTKPSMVGWVAMGALFTIATLALLPARN